MTTSSLAPEFTPDLTVVVPTRNAGRTIEACLESIGNQRGSTIELIVVDNHSTDQTRVIAKRFADRVILAGPERSTQRNVGLHVARAPLVAFFDADMVLTPDVCAEASAMFATTEAAGVIVPETSFGEGFFARCRALEKRLYLGNADVEAARVFATDDVRSIGGYREDLVAGEDWDLSDRIEAGAPNRRLHRTEAPILHDDGRISLRETFRKKQYYGVTFVRYVRTRTDDRPRRLARPELRSAGDLLRIDPLATGGLVVLKAVEAAGLAVGAAKGLSADKRRDVRSSIASLGKHPRQ